MAKGKHFGAVLARLRDEQGFKSAYAFYKNRGGQRGLRLTFANYLALEKGRSLPQGPRLEGILDALGYEPGSPPARELIYAYLTDLFGSEKLLAGLGKPGGPDPAPSSWQLAEAATRQALHQRSIQLNLDQYKVLAQDRAAYFCHVVLCNTKDWMTKAGLAKQSGESPAKVAKALKALSEVGMAELKGDKAQSPLAGKYVVPPAVTPATASIYAALMNHRQDWLRKAPAPAFTRYLLLRAKEGKMQEYLQHLGDAVSMSALYGDVKPGDDSHIYWVEGKVVKLFG